MNLDYYVKPKRREMEQQANHYRLVQQVREPNDRFATVAEMVGRQLIRLGTALNRLSHEGEMAIYTPAEPQCCPAT